jgi:hypothetical protein
MCTPATCTKIRLIARIGIKPGIALDLKSQRPRKKIPLVFTQLVARLFAPNDHPGTLQCCQLGPQVGPLLGGEFHIAGQFAFVPRTKSGSSHQSQDPLLQALALWHGKILAARLLRSNPEG